MSESNPRLASLMKSVDLREVFSQETTHRSVEESKTEEPTQNVNQEDFSQEPVAKDVESIEQTQEPTVQIERKPNYNAEQNAQSLVYGLQALEQMVLSPLAMFRMHKKIGGKEVKTAMLTAYQKKMSGGELNDEDNRLIAAFEDYERKVSLLTDSILPNEKKTEFLIRAAKPYCEETQMEIKSGLAFWASYGGDFAEKITKIMMM